MSTFTVNTPAKVAAPRFAAVAAALFVGLMNAFRHRGAQHAERQVQVTRASEAAAVREYAHRFMKHDPRFAADLFAAADRHELGA